MSKTLLAAVATMAVFSSATLATRAAAMTVAVPPALGIASAPALTRVAILCGMNGCAPIHVARVWHQPRGYTTRAAPLNMPGTNPPQNSSPNQPANK